MGVGQWPIGLGLGLGLRWPEAKAFTGQGLQLRSSGVVDFETAVRRKQGTNAAKYPLRPWRRRGVWRRSIIGCKHTFGLPTQLTFHQLV